MMVEPLDWMNMLAGKSLKYFSLGKNMNITVHGLTPECPGSHSIPS